MPLPVFGLINYIGQGDGDGYTSAKKTQPESDFDMGVSESISGFEIESNGKKPTMP